MVPGWMLGRACVAAAYLSGVLVLLLRRKHRPEVTPGRGIGPQRRPLLPVLAGSD
jgi:hypothetical protein